MNPSDAPASDSARASTQAKPARRFLVIALVVLLGAAGIAAYVSTVHNDTAQFDLKQQEQYDADQRWAAGHTEEPTPPQATPDTQTLTDTASLTVSVSFVGGAGKTTPAGSAAVLVFPYAADRMDLIAKKMREVAETMNSTRAKIEALDVEIQADQKRMDEIMQRRKQGDQFYAGKDADDDYLLKRYKDGLSPANGGKQSPEALKAKGVAFLDQYAVGMRQMLEAFPDGSATGVPLQAKGETDAQGVANLTDLPPGLCTVIVTATDGETDFVWIQHTQVEGASKLSLLSANAIALYPFTAPLRVGVADRRFGHGR